MKFATTVRLFSAAAVASLLLAPAAQADSGFYIGGAYGTLDIEDDGGEFDEDTAPYKIMGGYIFDMPVVDFAIEAAYVDFGSQEDSLGVLELDATGLSAFGIAGVDFGLFGIFGKLGFVSWDADLSGVIDDSESGTDPAYGLGMRLTFSSVEARLEYELFDFDGVDVDMLSLGVIWRF